MGVIVHGFWTRSDPTEPIQEVPKQRPLEVGELVRTFVPDAGPAGERCKIPAVGRLLKKTQPLSQHLERGDTWVVELVEVNGRPVTSSSATRRPIVYRVLSAEARVS